MVTKSQKRASRKWEKNNPERTSYLSLRRAAFRFVNPQPNTKSDKSIRANKDEYIEDIEELKRLLDKKMEG